MKLKQYVYRNVIVIGIAIGCLTSANSVWAQSIVGDGTLSTTVTSPDGLNFTITDGTQQGDNLFHSFSQFSVPTNGSAFFNNAPAIQNIIGRVTGGSASTIDGLIRTNDTANLFLLNPNGIIFGANAQLNVGGSFVASTANAITFADGTQFSATTPSSPPPLTISVPIGLQYGSTASAIQVQESTLAVQPSQTLALVGGDVSLEGSTITAAGGRVELGAVSGEGTVGLNLTDNQIQLSFPDTLARADLSLTDNTLVSTSAAGSGDIQLVGRQVMLQDSRVEATTQGSEAGGNLIVNASESVDIVGNEAGGMFSNGLFAETQDTGMAGNLSITTKQLTVRGEARVSAATFGAGAGGNLTVDATDSVELIGADSNTFQLFTGLLTDTESTGDAGNLMIETGRLIVRNGAQVSAATFGAGDGGNLTVDASESVELYGATPSDFLPSGLFTAVQPGALGDAGDLTVNTQQLIVRDGAQIFAGTRGAGNGGMLTVNAEEKVELIGVSSMFFRPSGLFTAVNPPSTANAGDLTINTEELVVRDGAQIAAAAFGEGTGGDLIVNASESVELIGTGPVRPDPLNPSQTRQDPSGLLSDAGGSGDSGNVTVTTGRLTVQDGAQVAVNNRGSGNAGNLEIAADSIRLNNRGTLTAETASGEGGNINLQVQDLLLMRQESLISAEAGGTGNGGNIDIDTPFLIAFENSDIIANAFEGRGGNIQITAQSIFNIQFCEQNTSESCITASSEFGIDGVVRINTPEVDPDSGLVTLPEDVVDVTGLIAQGCGTDRGIASSEFIVTGRGGLPPTPSGTIPSDAVLEDLGTAPVQRTGNVASTHPMQPSLAPIIEAQGWSQNSKGQVVLTAQAPRVTSISSWQNPAICQ